MNTKPLWSVDRSGDSWLGSLDNPHVLLANPPKRKKGGHNRKGVVPAGLARYWATHARRNPPSSMPVKYRNTGGQTVTWIKASAKKAKKRAQAGFGSKLPSVAMFAGATGGFVGASWISRTLATYLPTSITGSTPGYWAIKIASAIVPGLILRKMVKGSLGVAVLVGGVLNLVVDGIRSFFPTLLGSQPMLGGMGYYTSGVVAGALPYRRPRQLGMYSPPDAYPAKNTTSPMLATAPTRLSPGNRF